MIKELLVVILVFSLTETIAQNDSTKNAFSLNQAQEFAANNAYNVKLAKLDVDKSIKKKNEVRGMGLPQVNASGSFQNFTTIPTTVMPNFVEPAIIQTLVGAGQLPPSALDQPLNQPFIEAEFGTSYNTKLGVSASQLLFDGSYLVGLKVAKQYIGFYEQVEKQTVVNTIDEVTKAYYTALVAKENKDNIEKSLKNFNKTFKETKAMYEAGFLEEQDVDQMQITISGIENSLSSASRNVEMSLQVLKLNMGMDISDPIELTDDLEAVVSNLKYDDLASQNITFEKNIDFKILQTNKDMMRMNWKLEQAANLPSLSAYFSHQQSNQVNDIDFYTWFPSTVWGINLDVPIFGSGQRMYKSQVAKIEYEKVGVQLSQTEQALKMQSNVAKLELQTAYDNYQTQKKNLMLAEKIQNKTLKRFQEGLASSMEVTQVQNQYLQTQGAYIGSIFQLLTAKAKLDKIHNNY